MWTDADARGFATRLAALAEVFAEPLTAVRVAGYRAALDDLAPGEVFAAIGSAAKTCRFFPKPVELREFVDETRSRALAEARRVEARTHEQLRRADEQRQLAARLDTERNKPVSQEAIDKCRADLRAIIQRATMPGCTPRDDR